jgi:hypothetical protein
MRQANETTTTTAMAMVLARMAWQEAESFCSKAPEGRQ